MFEMGQASDYKDCFICKEKLDTKEVVEVGKGMANLRKASAEREDGLLIYLENIEAVTIHLACQKNYVCKRQIQAYKKKKQMLDNESETGQKKKQSVAKKQSPKVDINNCFMCARSLKTGDTVQVKKGLANLRRASKERGDGFADYLKTVETITVHSGCRRNYICRNQIKAFLNKKKSA